MESIVRVLCIVANSHSGYGEKVKQKNCKVEMKQFLEDSQSLFGILWHKVSFVMFVGSCKWPFVISLVWMQVTTPEARIVR